MQPWSSVWVFTVLILVLLSSATEARRNKEKPKGDTYNVTAKKMKKKGFTLDCRPPKQNSGHIVSLSVVGQNNTCSGLTASMLVQVNSCLWTTTCRLKADRNDNYMLRLYKGTPEDCILRSPHNYLITYLCARPQVPVIDLRAAGGAAQEENAGKGILRSHEDHPWLYRHRQDRTLTLVRPNASATTFLYTILKLSLYNDVLRVTTGNRNLPVISHKDDVTNMTAKPIVGERWVKFELEMSRYSTGEEGFVICFQWLTDKEAEMKKDNACNGLLSRGSKRKKKGGRKRNPGKSGRRKKKQKNKKRGRKGKTTTTTTTPRP